MASTNKYGLSIGYWNIDGLQPKHNDKTNDLDFIEFVNSHDIVGIGETHLSTPNSLFFNNYKIVSVIRPRTKNSKRNFGGISIFVRNNLKHFVTTINDKEETNYMWIKINGQHISRKKDLYICFTHIPHENSTYYDKIDYDIFANLYQEIVEYKKIGDTALLGDFNGRVGLLDDWINSDDVNYVPVYTDYECDTPSSKRNNKDECVNNRGKAIIDLCIAANVRIANGRTTGDLDGKFTFFKNGVSAIDLCLTNEDLRSDILFFKVNDLCRHISDHCSITLNIVASYNECEKEVAGNVFQLPQQYKWDETSKVLLNIKWNSTETSQIITKFIDEDTEQLCTNKLAEACTAIIQNVANGCLRKSKMYKKNKKRENKWFDTELKDLRKSLRHESRKIKNGIPTKVDLDKLNFLSKTYKRACKIKYNDFRKKLILEVENINKNNPKEGWEALKKLKGREYQSNNITPNNWYNHYKNLNSMKYDFLNIREEQNNEIDQIIKQENIAGNESLLLKQENIAGNESLLLNLDKDISECEYTKAVRKLKNNKSAGLDLVRNEIIKSMNPKANSMIITLFNKILKSGEYPKIWCQGVITSLFKSGDRDDENNYRGITITSCLSKLFNSILNERLVNFRNENKIDTKEQIAYQKGASTVDHIFTFNTIIEKYRKLNKPLFCCFVDMKKAFDSVLHSAILLKLLKSGVRGNFFKTIKSMYASTKLSVKVGNTSRTNFFDSELGIRQGDNLSPNLFNLIMNDLPEQLKTINCDPIWLNKSPYNCMLYADDIVLFSETKEGLEKAISKTMSYSKNQGLVLNLNKTKVMYITKGGRLSKKVYRVDGHLLEEVKQYKYLGIIFSNNGSLKTAKMNLYNVGIKAMYGLKNMVKNLHLSVKTLLHLFTSLIQPIVSYACEVVSIINVSDRMLNENENMNFFQTVMSQPQEKLHLHFCKFILGVNSKASNIAVLSELGRVPIFVHNMKKLFKFHQKCKNNTESLLHEAYVESKNTGLSWYKFIVYTLKKLDIQEPDIDYCEDVACHKLGQLYKDFWKKSIFNDTRRANMGNKLRSYRMFKIVYECEPYLKCISDFNIRQIMCKFRISNHRLKIETGRFNNTPLEERNCTLCNTLENEIHFLTECKKFDTLRKELYDSINEVSTNFMELENTEKFIYMLSTCDENIIRKIGKFLFECMQNAGYI
jgi:hypothetical protein